MILFIDDQPDYIKAYVDSIIAIDLQVHILSTIAEIKDYIINPSVTPSCIVLDVMFPGDQTLPGFLTEEGMKAGMLLFASLRSRFPRVHIIVFTNSFDIAIRDFFQRQDKCSLYYKTELLPDELASVIKDIVNDRGSSLLASLSDCNPGHKHSKVFEEVCTSILEFLFVPPLTHIIPQSARSNGHDIRDAILPNNAIGFFWESIRREFGAKHLVVEFKNYKKPIGKNEVIQLRQYLNRKSIGRFGILISRCPPSESALIERKDAYSDQDILILFIDDVIIKELIMARRQGQDPSIILQEMKESFEINY